MKMTNDKCQDFEDKVVVITGAAKGIGKAIATAFSKQGAITVIADFDEVAGKEAADKITAQYKKTIFVKTDVSSYEAVLALRNKIITWFGKIDILIVNAGISYHSTVQEITIKEWDQVIAINLSGSFYTIKAFYEDFLKANSGKIVFVTSGSAITGTGGGAHYAASKAGQHGLMRSVSKELGPKGINVNAIAPRVIETEILDKLYPTEESRANLLKQIPINRIGKPEDIANAALFLASEKSSYIHGQIILADGGRTY